MAVTLFLLTWLHPSSLVDLGVHAGRPTCSDHRRPIRPSAQGQQRGNTERLGAIWAGKAQVSGPRTWPRKGSVDVRWVCPRGPGEGLAEDRGRALTWTLTLTPWPRSSCQDLK